MKLHFRNLAAISRQHQLPPGGNHENQVHIWSHTLHFDDPFLREAPYMLSDDELSRATRYHHERDKRVYESGHVLIRKVLAHYTSLDPAKLVLTPVVNRKPELMNAPFKIHFNITHSGHKILVAVGFSSDVGVDVEKSLTDFDTDGFSEANYHPNEVAHLKKLSGKEETDYFYTVWTRKEAWLKLTGEGINDQLKNLDFSGKDSKSSLPAQGHHELYMTSWNEGDDYIATLAAYTQPGNIHFFASEALLTDFSG